MAFCKWFRSARAAMTSLVDLLSLSIPAAFSITCRSNSTSHWAKFSKNNSTQLSSNNKAWSLKGSSTNVGIFRAQVIVECMTRTASSYSASGDLGTSGGCFGVCGGVRGTLLWRQSALQWSSVLRMGNWKWYMWLFGLPGLADRSEGVGADSLCFLGSDGHTGDITSSSCLCFGVRGARSCWTAWKRSSKVNNLKNELRYLLQW